MTDREKVIKWLEKEIKSNDYWDKDYIDCIPVLVLNDILALLKAHEPVKPYVSGKGKDFENASTWWYACGNCNKPIDPNDKYCRYCGRKVAWDDDRQGD